MFGDRPWGRELAVALGYDGTLDTAPRVLATGHEGWAAHIRRLAERHKIPIRQDDELAEFLARVPAGEQIPPELYPAVAEIFAFLYRLEQRGEIREG